MIDFITKMDRFGQEWSDRNYRAFWIAVPIVLAGHLALWLWRRWKTRKASKDSR